MSVRRSLRGREISDLGAFVEALLLLVLVKVALRTLPYSRLTNVLDTYVPVARRARSTVTAITRAAGAAARRIGGATCLAQALVVHTMLRRRGHAACLRIGVRRNGGTSFEAHAWVECNGVVVIGELPEIAAYAVLA